MKYEKNKNNPSNNDDQAKNDGKRSFVLFNFSAPSKRGRYYVYFLIGLAIAVALIGPFVWSCIEHNVDIKEALDIWNSFVSIALGYVATTLAIVSIVLSFKTYDDALKVQENAVETLLEIKKVRQDVDDLKNGRLSSSKGDAVQTTDAKTQNVWAGEPDQDDPEGCS